MSLPIVSICRRAGWVMCGVKDKYLLSAKSSGDQYVGRFASGLDHLEKCFPASPPYFDFSSIEDEIEKNPGKRNDQILAGFQATTEG